MSPQGEWKTEEPEKSGPQEKPQRMVVSVYRIPGQFVLNSLGLALKCGHA